MALLVGYGAATVWAAPLPATPAEVQHLAVTATTITLQASAPAVQGCGTVQVEIWINDVADLYGADCRLSFDPAALEVVDAEPGSSVIQIVPLGGFLQTGWVIKKEADNTAGTIWYAVTQTNPEPPKSGSGAIARITFRAKSPGPSALHFTYTKLATLNGNPISATPVDGSLGGSPPPVPVLTISKQTSSTARLTWTGVSGVAGYHLYRDTAPYFAPSGSPYYTTTGLSYDDVGVLGDPAINHYYLIRSACANGFESVYSNRVGEFDFALVPGSAPGNRKYNFITLVLEVAGITDADSLADYVAVPPAVYQVMRYDATKQGFTFPDNVWLPNFLDGTNFPVKVGQVYGLHLESTAPTLVTFVGGVPPEESVTFTLVPGSGSGNRKYNYISVPLDREDLATADQLADDIGVGDVYQVMRYDATKQGYTFPDNVWLPQFEDGTDFPVRIGYPYVVHLEYSAPTTWPEY